MMLVLLVVGCVFLFFGGIEFVVGCVLSCLVLLFNCFVVGVSLLVLSWFGIMVVVCFLSVGELFCYY